MPGANTAAVVPRLYVAPYADEFPCELQIRIDPERGVSLVDELPEDRDVDGTLWQRWAGSRTGPLQMSEHHPVRQRQCMEYLRCAVGAGQPDRGPDGMLWLLPATPAFATGWPRDVVTVTPPVCQECADRALAACEVLRRGYVMLRVRESELVGVRGTLYSLSAPPLANQDVLFTDTRIRFMVARQYLRVLRDATLDSSTPLRRGRRITGHSACPSAAQGRDGDR
ncbi:hypothetical protein [Streptomyces sp. NPDC001404]|uniref:hypothetical protein n=1 Tax=Streptomyces sp. NPDC001404 TaxID=3364571 RepID=UPI0036A9231B